MVYAGMSRAALPSSEIVAEAEDIAPSGFVTNTKLKSLYQ